MQEIITVKAKEKLKKRVNTFLRLGTLSVILADVRERSDLLS